MNYLAIFFSLVTVFVVVVIESLVFASARRAVLFSIRVWIAFPFAQGALKIII